jgi:hypothetical protein
MRASGESFCEISDTLCGALDDYESRYESTCATISQTIIRLAEEQECETSKLPPDRSVTQVALHQHPISPLHAITLPNPIYFPQANVTHQTTIMQGLAAVSIEENETSTPWRHGEGSRTVVYMARAE